MKFTGLRENFQKALLVLQRIVMKNPSLPILENILIETENKRLKISATNLELGVHVWVKGKTEDEGRVCIPAYLLTNSITNSNEERVTIESEGINLTMKTESFEGTLKGQDPNEFPLIPNPAISLTTPLDVKHLAEGLAQVSYIAAVSEIYPEISGIYFSFSKGSLTIVATDSFRLGKKEISLTVPKEMASASFILPLRSAQELLYILEQSAQTSFNLGVNENQAVCSFDDITIVSRLLAGTYPNTSELIPKEFNAEIILERQSFIEKLKLISVFAPKTNDCKIEIREDTLLLSSSATAGSSKATLKVKVKGSAPGAITFNYRYLLDGLLRIKSSDALLRVKNESTPVVFQGVSDDSHLYLVAPLKS